MKLVSKVLGIGVLALLAGAFAPHSSARAQVAPEGCLTDGLNSDARMLNDRAAATIFCSERVECTALLCKDRVATTLERCLEAADGNAAAIRKCDAAAIASLAACQLNGARGDAACYINPNGGTTAPAAQ